MKKLFIVLGVSLALAACGGKSGGASGDTTSSTNKTAVATEPNAANDTAASHNGTEKTGGASAAGADLIAKSDCSTCHKEQDKVVGPAFADIADKYKSGGEAIVDTLANKIINGGSGHWGTTPMAAHPSISQADAKTIVEYILTIKKK